MSTFTLSIQYCDRPSETLQFSGSRFIVGREYGDIVLRDPKVSGRHGELRIDPAGNALTFTDLNSSNGSYRADGQRIAGTIRLVVGSIIYIGSSSLTVLAIGAPEPAPAPMSAPPKRGSTVVADVASVKEGAARGVVSGEIASMSGAGPAPASAPAPAQAPPQQATPQGFAAFETMANAGYPAPRPGVPRGGTLPPTDARPAASPAYSAQPVGAPIPLAEPAAAPAQPGPSHAAPAPGPKPAPAGASEPPPFGVQPEGALHRISEPTAQPAAPTARPAQPTPAQPAPAAARPDQPTPAQPAPAAAAQSARAQAAQPTPAQPTPAQPMAAQPAPAPKAQFAQAPASRPASPTSPAPKPAPAKPAPAKPAVTTGTWHEVQAGVVDSRTFVMALSGGNIIVRTQTRTHTGLVETMVVAPGSLADFTLAQS